MATQPVVDCFYTHVQNQGPERTYGFLGLHGRRLAQNEQLTVPGNLIDTLAARATGPEGNRRHFQALERSMPVNGGNLVIIKTPAVHLFDPVADVTKMLTISGGTLGKADPCWSPGLASSSAGVEVLG